ncbi:MAG: isoprenylcysteine carboxylmethyltransferase family protein [Bacteroidia bacterium]|nr:isoprenylcysteine carboxylmethyltransferase family protein [Bacteroidia bacterium]
MKLRIVPPVLTFLSGLAMWAIANYIEFGEFEVEASWRKSVFLVFMILGSASGMAAIIAFRAAKTSLDPMNPSKTSVLITEGIFQWTRNPMYLGLLAILIGWAFYLQNALALFVLAFFYVYMSRVQIKSEEEALQEKFGESYTVYTEKVRRWL